MSVDLPKECVLLNQIHIVEYIGNEDGEIQKFAVCEGSDGTSMDIGKVLEMLEWCKAQELAPMQAEILAAMIREDYCEDEDDYGDS